MNFFGIYSPECNFTGNAQDIYPSYEWKLLIWYCSHFNSLWPSDAIWRQGSGSILAQVMACCPTAPSHYLTNVDWSSMRSRDIHIRAISQEMAQPSITKIRLKITYLKLYSNLPGASELRLQPHLPGAKELKGQLVLLTCELNRFIVCIVCVLTWCISHEQLSFFVKHNDSSICFYPVAYECASAELCFTLVVLKLKYSGIIWS